MGGITPRSGLATSCLCACRARKAIWHRSARIIGGYRSWLATCPCRSPQPAAKGRPSAAFPRPWSVYRWIEGEPAYEGRIADLAVFAADLAGWPIKMLNQITWAYTNGMDPANAVIASAIRLSALFLRCSACWSSTGLRGWGSVRIATITSSLYRPEEAGGRFWGEQQFRRGRDMARHDVRAFGLGLLATVQECPFQTGGTGRTYLSAPAVSPEMIRRWAKITSKATGKVTSTTAASIRL